MARRGLGGSGDWSGSFASLYNFNRNEARAEQDAADADAADRWANGLMSDDEWMAYIQTAIDREAGDPKRQQKWVTALRKYGPLIADKQAEAEYEMGGSIDALVAHYQGRLKDLVKESNEYRELEIHLNDLLDKRSGETLSEAAEDMIEQINLGKKTYQDLRTLLQQGLDESRPNSDLRKSIEKQLDDVKETIRVNELEGTFARLQYEFDAGKRSGGSYAKELRRLAQQFQANDPQRYFQILRAAVQLEQSGARGGSGGSGGGGGGGGGSSTKSINKSIDALQAKRNNVQALLEQFNAGAPRGVDPATGATVVFNEGVIRDLDLALIRSFDELTAAYNVKGDLSAAANTQKAKADYIATDLVKHNTMAVEDSRRELALSTAKVLDNALSNPDPTAALSQIRSIAQNWQKYGRGLAESSIQSPGFGGDIKRNLPAESPETVFTGPRGLLDQIDPEMVSQAQAFGDALLTLATSGLDDASAEAALATLYGADGGSNSYVQLAAKALEINSREQGLASGDLVRIATPNGLAWARTSTVTFTAPSPTGGAAVQVTQKVPTEVRNGDKWQALDVDGQSQKLVDIFMDINGTPTKVQAVASLSNPQGFNAWVASSTKKVDGMQLVAGRPLTDAQMKKLLKGGRTPADLAALGFIEPGPAFQSWTVTTPEYTDKGGRKHSSQVWNQDPATGLWYKGALPVRGAQRDADGMVRFGPEGALIDWRSYGSASGVPAPYAGTNAKEMQNRLNSGEVDVADIRGRDMLGNVTDEITGLDTAYFDPNFVPLVDQARDTWWNDKDRKERERVFKQFDPRTRHRPQHNSEEKFLLDMKNSELGQAALGVVGEVAKALGINLGGTKPKPQFGGMSPDERGEFKLPDVPKPGKKAGGPATITLPQPKATSGPAIKAELPDLGIKPVAPAQFGGLSPDERDELKQAPKTAPKPITQPAPETQTTKKRGSNYLL